MKVPRETISRHGRTRWPALHLPTAMLEGLAAGRKSQHRFLVTEDNTIVRPGCWPGVDLETGRARILDGNEGNPAYEIRARCRFPSGDVRAVSLQPRLRVGDLYWVKGTGGTLKSSKYTVEVVGVSVARLQDMSDEDALAEGLDPVNGPRTPREEFRALWDRRQRAGGFWRSNPWVWVARIATHRCHVRELAERSRP